MAKKILSLPPRHTKPAVAAPPEGLTLADVTVTRRILDDQVTRITGPELAQLIDAMQPEKDHPPLVSPGAICEELDCLADLVQVLGAADNAECGVPLDKPLYWVGESLKRLGRRVMALQQSGNAAPNWYAVELKK